MNLTLHWTNPVQHPSCGYKALYRRMSASTYTELDTSGSTSSGTTVQIAVSAPASYEGYIQGNCCSDNVSAGDPFGVNGYGTVAVAVSVQANPLHYLATITSTYANPYINVITGHFTSSSAGIVNFTASYPANSTSAIVVLAPDPNSAAEVITNVRIDTISPSFSNGGSLQQLDPVRTPAYFEFYSTSGSTSGTTTWNGDPLRLPSFTLNAFNVTETNLSGNPIAGNLLVSWIQDYVYAAGTGIYTTFTILVREQATHTTVGTLTFTPSTNGLLNATIELTQGSTYLSSSLLYQMLFYWEDGILVDTKDFYLPLF